MMSSLRLSQTSSSLGGHLTNGLVVVRCPILLSCCIAIFLDGLRYSIFDKIHLALIHTLHCLADVFLAFWFDHPPCFNTSFWAANTVLDSPRVYNPT